MARVAFFSNNILSCSALALAAGRVREETEAALLVKYKHEAVQRAELEARAKFEAEKEAREKAEAEATFLATYQREAAAKAELEAQAKFNAEKEEPSTKK